MKILIYLFFIVIHIIWSVKINRTETQIFQSLVVYILILILFELTVISKKPNKE